MNSVHARRKLRRLSFGLAVAGALLVLAGCGATTMTDLWRDPSYSGPVSRNLLVISMAKDPQRRRMWEDSFCSGLRTKGANATASYTLFPDQLPDTESVKQKVRDNGYDAVIVSHRLGTDRVERFVPPVVSTTPVTRVSPWGYYHTYYQEVVSPGYVESDRVVRFQTDFWIADGKGGRLVWIGRSESVNPTSPAALSKEVSGKILPELTKKGLL